MSVVVDDPLHVQALALRDGARLRVILANMRDEPARVSLELPEMGETRVRRLDDKTVYQASSDPAVFRASGGPLGEAGTAVTIDLPSHGLITLDSERKNS